VGRVMQSNIYYDIEMAKWAREHAIPALTNIRKRPDLPNPDKDADWKNCMKWSAHDAKEALEKMPKKENDHEDN
jgi:hypothetical protein